MKRLQIALLVAAGCGYGGTLLAARENPLELKVEDLEARLIRIERVLDNQSLIQLATEVQKLRAENQALRGELDKLRYDSTNSDNRQRELYVDLDRRLQNLEAAPRAAVVPAPVAAPPAATAGTQAPAPSAAPPPPARPIGSDQQNYQAAFDLIQARKYEDAGRAFRDFLTAFPQSPLADNAQYWLAETHYVRRQFKEALPEFQKVTTQYPQAAKMPDALLKIGYCQIELGDKAAARVSLQQVMKQFPDTTAARLASQRLEQLSR
ncbi:MAG TPA: tol-pal system protein YbgF [Gammaproteobacteria bacterium]|nr:tol-pal system protein YbgF [Gammaproteobacteria bacterium]